MEKPRSSTQHHAPRRHLFAAGVLSFLAATAGYAAAPVQISGADALRIGKRVWQNESNGSIAGLTAWNSGEDFASLGIGHFIWYPEGMRGPFEESFPKFLEFAHERNVTARRVTALPANH